MGFFKLFKKKEKLFGNNVEKNCAWCRYNYTESEEESSVLCKFWVGEDAAKCKKYEYDPTKRRPKAEPKLKEYKKEDFEL